MIIWEEEAKDDLHRWLDYMALRNPEAGEQKVMEVFEAVETLADHPLSGRVGKVHGTRELVIPDNPLLIVYTAEEDCITILFVPHQRQQWPQPS